MKNFKVRIGCYTWQVRFVDAQELPRSDGQTRCNTLEILIRDSLDENAKRLTFIHEVIHALLNTQGRFYQNKFTQEEVCEFIAWRFNEIQEIIEIYENNQARV